MAFHLRPRRPRAPKIEALMPKVEISRTLGETRWRYKLSCTCGYKSSSTSENRYVGLNLAQPFYTEGWRVIEGEARCPSCVEAHGGS